MGSRKYLPLTPEELRRVLKAFGFVRKRTRGDHEQWEPMSNLPCFDWQRFMPMKEKT